MLPTLKKWWKYVFIQYRGGVVSYPLVTFTIYLIFKLTQRYLPIDPTYLEIQAWVDASVGYIELHPYRIIIGSLAVGIFIHMSSSAYRRERLIVSFGANFFSERSTQAQKQEDWNYFLTKVLEENPSQLKILGASGYETFHLVDSPLHKLIEAFPYSVKILLLDANSQYVPERAQSVGEKTAKYRSDITDSFRWLKGLSQRNPKVEVKTYDHLPNWKMILTDKHLWLQYYMPNKHVDDSVVYIIYRNNDNSSLYEPFYNEFHRLWNAASNGKQNILPARQAGKQEDKKQMPVNRQGSSAQTEDHQPQPCQNCSLAAVPAIERQVTHNRNDLVRLFISYSHKDESFKDTLEVYLKNITRRIPIEYWSDKNMFAGGLVDAQIMERLDTASIVILLVSPDFVASDYCFNIEMESALKKREEGKGVVIPVIIRETTDWRTFGMGKLLALPDNGKPLKDWHHPDEFWASVQEGIRRAVENLQIKQL